MTNKTISPLDAAREHLRHEANRAVEGDDTRWMLLEPLAAVADMVCRIGDHWDSAQYQAGKAGDMVRDALRVQRQAFARQVGSEERAEPVRVATELLDDLETAVQVFFWTLSRNFGAYDHADARQMGEALRKFTSWAESVMASAVPVPED